MYCANCGKESPHDANFYLQCGRPQRDDVRPDEPLCETCGIRFRDQRDSGGFFRAQTFLTVYRAEAIGPDGRYNAGESRAVPGPSTDGWATAACAALDHDLASWSWPDQLRAR